MQMKSGIFIKLASFAWLVLMTFTSCALAQEAASPPASLQQGVSLGADSLSAAPSFALYDVNDNLVKYSGFKGKKVVVLSFFATYCKPCLPEIQELQNLSIDKNNVEIILITNEDKKVVLPYIEKYKVGIKVLLDKFGAASRSYKVLGLPSLFLINKRGEIVFKTMGGTQETIKRLKEEIKKLTI